MLNEGPPPERRNLSPAEIGALAHLYRGEVYRSTLWRTRLDTTTNWSVVTLGIALSITFSTPSASPLPLILVGILIFFFLMLEARRYRYFNVWRARCRWMEVHFFAPMLDDGDLHLEENWQQRLAADYRTPRYHVSTFVAVGRRIRRNYLWILWIQTGAYLGKLVVHPNPLNGLDQFRERAAVGPIDGIIILALGALYCITWTGIAMWSWNDDRRRARWRREQTGMG